MSLNTISESKNEKGDVTHKIESAGIIDNTPKPIRAISTGAMQRRFTITEEVFITSDAAATVIKSRLLNASYCDLDFKDTVEGIAYICDILAAGGVTKDGVTSEVRVAGLLVDGTEKERYS